MKSIRLLFEKMSLKLVANNKQTNIDNFTIELPETSLKLDTIHLEYDSLKAFDRFTEQVHFSFRTLPSQVTLKIFLLLSLSSRISRNR